MNDGNDMDVGIEVLRSMRLTFVLLQAVSVDWGSQTSVLFQEMAIHP